MNASTDVAMDPKDSKFPLAIDIQAHFDAFNVSNLLLGRKLGGELSVGHHIWFCLHDSQQC